MRAINDVVLAFPDVLVDARPIAVPLRVLADAWIGFYWPFADAAAPIRQGPRSRWITKGSWGNRLW